VSTELRTIGRLREVTGSLYIERWLQIDAGTTQIYGNSASSLVGDLNVLDALADSRTVSSSGRLWYGAANPGEYDAGESNKAWYGQVVRVPFKIVQASAQWEALYLEMKSFVETAFPGELVLESNQRFDRPKPDDVNSPAKYVIWAIEY